MHKRFILIFIIFNLCVNISNSSDKDPIKVIATNFPPYTIESGYSFSKSRTASCLPEKKTGYGIDIDILTEALRLSGYDYEVKYVPFARLSKKLKLAQPAVSAGLFYAENENGTPRYKYVMYDIGGATIFYKKSGASIKVFNVENLRNLRIGVVREDSYGNLFDEEIGRGNIQKENLDEAVDDLMNFRKLVGGRIDILAINNIVGPYLVKENKLEDHVERLAFQFEYGNDPTKNGIYLAFSQETSDAVVSSVASTIKAMKKNGLINCIKALYGVTLSNDLTIE